MTFSHTSEISTISNAIRLDLKMIFGALAKKCIWKVIATMHDIFKNN